MPLSEVLGNVQIFCGADTLQFQSALSTQFAQSIELKDFPTATYSRLLDVMLYNSVQQDAPYCFIETQSFTCMSKLKGLKVLKQQQNQLKSANDDGVSQIQLLSFARDMVANGELVMGDYSYSLLVFGENEKAATKNANDSIKKLQDAGFLPIKSTLALFACFLHQIGRASCRERV